MANFKILGVVFLTVWLITGCSKKEESFKPLPKQITAGNDSIIYDTTELKLNGTSLDSIKLIGTWRIIKGDTLSSHFSNIHDPQATFKGKYKEKYILEWSTTNGNNFISDSISLRFIVSIPSNLTAGFLYLVYDTNYVVLRGTSLKDGLLGKWSVITGDSSDIKFSEKNISDPICIGKRFNHYIIRWSVSNGIEEKFADASFVIGDEFIDSRDTKKYKIVKIGDQIWMAEDLKTDKYVDGTNLPLLEDNTSLYDNNVNDKAYFIRSYYYDYSGNVYSLNEVGYFYTWAAIMNNSLSSNNSPSNVQGICPNGWHVPSPEEFNELLNYIREDYFSNKEGLALRSNYGWYSGMDIGANCYGFSALPKGYHYSDHYGETGSNSSFWTTMETNYESFGKRYYAYYFNISWNYANVTSSAKVEGRCVRCLQNK